MKKYKNFAFKLEEILEGPFIMGDTLPIYADYLLYACLVSDDIFTISSCQTMDSLALLFPSVHHQS